VPDTRELTQILHSQIKELDDVTSRSLNSKNDILKDPLIRQLMRADGVRAPELSTLMADVAARLDGTHAGRPAPLFVDLDDIECRSDPRFEACSKLLRMPCSWTMH
jgi:hypothetical protein